MQMKNSAYLVMMKYFASLLCIFAASLFADPVVDAESGLTVNLWADEKLVANPVCIALDEKNRVFVGESFRQSKGIEDNRSHGYWLMDDLASQTVEDRLALIKKWSETKKPLTHFTDFEDRITRLDDADGDAKADVRTILADGFNDPLDGTGAGLIARNGSVWYTCIPHVWKMDDSNDDGVAETKESISYGYGVRWALRGHDSHGLVWGPDGRLYWSIGDRGYNITTKEGHTYHDPGSGAVFRSEPDGSNLELFFRGLRNPQELAFDARGNLFTGDNNSDAGDKARIMYLPEGGLMGWQMAYQTLGGDYSRGAWHMDKLWHLQHEDQPAWIIPSLAHISNGPSGFVYYPGVGMKERYDNHFFLADFKGGAAASYIWSFEFEEHGAGFEVIDNHAAVKNILVTDVDFSTDGRMFASDWINGWSGEGTGKIWTFEDPEARQQPDVASAAKVFAEGIETQTPETLAGLLHHGDQRVRLRSQFALAERGLVSAPAFFAAAQQRDHALARLHGIWGIGQLCRYHKTAAPAEALLPLLGDTDTDVVCQAAKVLAEAGVSAAAAELMKLLSHDHARVRCFAAMELGRLKHTAAVDGILKVLSANKDTDAFLRHGCVMGLTWMDNDDLLLTKVDGVDRSARLGILLALRRHEDARIAQFLTDEDPFLVAEAGRAIYDLPIMDAMPALAASLSPASQTAETYVRRAVAANLRLGGPDAVARLADYSASVSGKPAEIALAALEQWTAPEPREPVHGHFVPLDPRSVAEVKPHAEKHISTWMAAGGGAQRLALRMAKNFELEIGDSEFTSVALDKDKPLQNRIEAIKALAQRGGDENLAVLGSLLEDRSLEVRAASLVSLVAPAPEQAFTAARSMLHRGQATERQAAADALALLATDEADAEIKAAMKKVIGGKMPGSVTYDLVEAAKTRNMPELVSAWEASLDASDPLARFRPALTGGNADRGKDLFANHQAAQCMRCHATDDGHEEKMIGPNLHDLAKKQKADYILESLIEPSKVVAEGFGIVTLVKTDGSAVSGALTSEKDGVVLVQPLEGDPISVAASDIASRTPPVSAMPPMGYILQPRELRDVVAYLNTLR